MNIICTQENLKSALATVGRVVSSTNTLPILNNLLIKTENGQLKLSSTNLEIAITTGLRCKIEEEGAITVVSKTFSDLINNLPNKNIKLQTDNGQLLVEAENYHTSIKTLPAEDFPLIPQVEGKTSLKMDAQALKKALDQVVFAASNNQTQPEISGIYFARDKDGVRLVATDRYRLAEKKLPSGEDSTDYEAIIPQKSLLELSRIIGPQKGEVELTLSENQLGINFNETQIISRLVDGQYPDYRQIIPENFTTTGITDKNQLVAALRTAAVFSQSNNSVRLDFSAEKQQLVLTAESSELGKSQVELASKVDGKDSSMVLNYHYLLDCLSGLESENAVVKMIDDNSPSLIVPEGKNDYTYLVMPIKS